MLVLLSSCFEGHEAGGWSAPVLFRAGIYLRQMCSSDDANNRNAFGRRSALTKDAISVSTDIGLVWSGASFRASLLTRIVRQIQRRSQPIELVIAETQTIFDLAFHLSDRRAFSDLFLGDSWRDVHAGTHDVHPSHAPTKGRSVGETEDIQQEASRQLASSPFAEYLCGAFRVSKPLATTRK